MTEIVWQVGSETPIEASDDAVPDIAGLDIRPRQDEQWVLRYQKEIDGYYEVLKGLSHLDVTEIFRTLSAISARASELRTRLSRVDTKRAQNFRIREVEPLIEEIDRQFKLQSRALSVMEIEMRLSGERGMG